MRRRVVAVLVEFGSRRHVAWSHRPAPMDVLNWVRERQAAGRSRVATAGMLEILTIICEYGVQRGYLLDNPSWLRFADIVRSARGTPRRPVETLADRFRHEHPRARDQAAFLEFMEGRRSATYAEIGEHVYGDAAASRSTVDDLVKRVKTNLTLMRSKVWFRRGGEHASSRNPIRPTAKTPRKPPENPPAPRRLSRASIHRPGGGNERPSDLDPTAGGRQGAARPDPRRSGAAALPCCACRSARPGSGPRRSGQAAADGREPLEAAS